MTEREKELREIAQSEANSQLDAYEWLSLDEALTYDHETVELSEQETYFVFDLVAYAKATLPNIKLEDYTS